MHITIVPASTKTSQAAIRTLLASEGDSAPTVRGIYRNLARVPDEFKSHPRFEAVQGDIEDAASLDFAGSDAVMAVQPPHYDGRDTIAHAKQVSENIKAAIRKAEGSVRRLVYISSQGAQYEKGTGEILTNHAAETIFKDAAPEVVFIRCAYFMENWGAALETIPTEGMFYSTISPIDFALPHIATQDIGATAATELLATGTPLKTTPYAFDLEGPSYSSADVLQAWKQALGNQELKMTVLDKDALRGYYGAVFPPSTADGMTELNLCFLEGGILYENPKPTGETRYVKTELVEVLRQMLGTAA